MKWTIQFKSFYLLLIAIMAIGCSTEGVRSRLAKESLKFEADYAQASDTWSNASAGKAYKLTYQHTCFCVKDYEFMEVTVNADGEIGDVVFYDVEGKIVDVSNEIWAQELLAEKERYFMSVDKLFSIVEKKIDGEVEFVDVQYDEALGYPTTISVDYDSRIADDESTYEVLQLEFLE